MSTVNGKRLLEGPDVTYPDITSSLDRPNQLSIEPVSEKREAPDQKTISKKPIEQKPKKLTREERAVTDEKDKQEHAKLLRQGELNAKLLARVLPVPSIARQAYESEGIKQSFQKLWDNPDTPDPAAIGKIEFWNEEIQTDIKAKAVSNKKQGHPEIWHAEQCKLPYQEFLQFASQAKRIIQAKKLGCSEEALNQLDLDATKVSNFVVKDLPLFHIKLRQRGMPWQRYVASDILDLFRNLSREEVEARDKLVAEFLEGTPENFLQELSNEDKELIGMRNIKGKEGLKVIPETQEVSVNDDKITGDYNPAKKPRLGADAAADSDTSMFAAAPIAVPADMNKSATHEPKAVENDAEGAAQNNNQIIGLPTSAEKGNLPSDIMVNTEEVIKPGGLESQTGPPIPEAGLQVFSLEIHDDGRTFLGQVVHVLKVGEKGARVIVNEGTLKCPSFSIHPGAAFGLGVARAWIKTDQFGPQLDMSTMTRAGIGGMTNFVDVARTVEAPKRDRRHIRIYRLQATNKEIGWMTKHHLVKIVGRPTFKRHFGPIEEKIKAIQDLRRVKLDDFKQRHLHPDTAEKLTREDLKLMPWLGDGQEDDQGSGTEDDDTISEVEDL